jgi:protein SCO1/2
MKKEAACCLFAGLVFLISFGVAAEDGSHSDHPMGGDLHFSHESENQHQHPSGQEASGLPPKIGVEERLGEMIRPDIRFMDETGQSVSLQEAISKPSLILPVYFSCPQACNMMLASLAQAVNDVPLEPGRDYQVLAVSFDPEDTPEKAREAKANYFKLITRDFPQENWRFLTGGQKEIDALLASIGYRLQKTGPGMFIHPNVLLAVSPDGRIIRYLHGLRFLPFDLGMALTEAAAGTPHMSVRRILSYCFDYDAESKSYVFKSFRVAAIAILLLSGIFLFFLLRKGNRSKTHSEEVKKGNHP